MRTFTLKQAGLFLLITIAIFVTWVYWTLFGTWKLWNINQVTNITRIRFPASAKLISGDDIHCGPSQVALAKVQIPPADLPSFLSQTNMSAFTPSSPSQIDPSIAQMFQQRGWSLNNVSKLQVGGFSNGSGTAIWIDTDAPHVATVYIYFDEP